MATEPPLPELASSVIVAVGEGLETAMTVELELLDDVLATLLDGALTVPLDVPALELRVEADDVDELPEFAAKAGAAAPTVADPLVATRLTTPP